MKNKKTTIKQEIKKLKNNYDTIQNFCSEIDTILIDNEEDKQNIRKKLDKSNKRIIKVEKDLSQLKSTYQKKLEEQAIYNENVKKLLRVCYIAILFIGLIILSMI